MSKITYSKALTIKEYTKNYKLPENSKVSQEDEYIHRTQNTFLAKILKNNNVKIPQNEDINKTIQIIFHKEENRRRMINILKRRNHKVSRTSERLSLSKSNTQDISYDSIYDNIKGQKSFDFHVPIKKYAKLNLYTKKIVNKVVTPLINSRNKKSMKNKKEKEKNNLKLSLNKKTKEFKINESINSDKHSRIESNKLKNNNNYNNNVNDKNKTEKIKNVNNVKPSKIKIIFLKIEKGENIFYKSSTLGKSKINLYKDYKPEKCEEIIIKRKNDINPVYSGYILMKKNEGKNEEEIKLEEDKNKLKEIFINIMNEITKEEYEFITKKELLLLNEDKKENKIKEKKLKEKEDNNIKEKQKIKEQEKLIKENKELYLNLKKEFDKLVIENEQLKERINTLVEKEKELQNMNDSLLENKNEKIDEIQNLEFLIKQYENEIQKLKDEKKEEKEKNKIKEYRIEKIELNFQNKQNKEVEIKKDENINSNKEKEEKISRALNRIRKKKMIENNNEQNLKANNKKSDKILQIAKMLEQQMTGGKNEDYNNDKNINNEIKETNFLNLMEGKPIKKNKKKSSRVNFDDDDE